MSEPLRISIEGPVGRVILNRPEKRNAISLAMWLAIPQALAQLEADAGVRVILLQGEGAHFAAGADIAEFDEVYATRETAADYAAGMAGAMDALSTGRKPRIALIRGVCVGGGVALSLCCDLRFAETGARFAITPAKLGIAYSFADTRRLVARVGAATAADLLFSGRMIEAREAVSLRLIDRLFSAETLEKEVLAYAHLIAANAPSTIGVARDFIARALAGQTSENDATREVYLAILEGTDFQEGKAAFKEKRKPVF